MIIERANKEDLREILALQKLKRFELFTGHRSERNIYLYEKNGYHEFRREQASKNIIMLFMEKIAR
jgi:hypothetical protein